MSDLARYHKVIELEAQVEELRASLRNSERQTADSKRELTESKEELRIALRDKSQYRAKWRLAMKEHELPTDKARKLIAASKLNGFSCSVVKECARIGRAVGLRVCTVRVLWYKKSQRLGWLS